MRLPTPVEQRLLQTQRELQDRPEVVVDRSATGELGKTFDERPALFGYLPDWEGVLFSRELCVGSPRISVLGTGGGPRPGYSARFG